MSYRRERTDRLRRQAMTLIHNADTDFGGDLDIALGPASENETLKAMMYAQASAYLALEANERWSGEVSVNPTVDQHFDSIGEL